MSNSKISGSNRYINTDSIRDLGIGISSAADHEILVIFSMFKNSCLGSSYHPYIVFWSKISILLFHVSAVAYCSTELRSEIWKTKCFHDSTTQSILFHLIPLSFHGHISFRLRNGKSFSSYMNPICISSGKSHLFLNNVFVIWSNSVPLDRNRFDKYR